MPRTNIQNSEYVVMQPYYEQDKALFGEGVRQI